MAEKKFPNVPDHLQNKMERCVLKVKGQGKSKESAIAICFDSVVKSLEEPKMAKKKNKGKRQARKHRQAEMRARKEAELLAENPLADDEAEEGIEINKAVLPDSLKDYVIPDNSLNPTGAEIEEEEKSLHLVEDNSSHIPNPPGPTSFEEIDAEKEAREKTRQVRDVMFDAEDIFFGIRNNQEMDVDQKVNAFKKLADGFGSRVKSALGQTAKELEDVEDLEVLEVFQLSKSASDISAQDKVEEYITRAKLTTAGRKALPDSAFACIQDGVRSFPIHDKAHVRNALARAAQGLKAGDKAATKSRCALPKIRAAAKKMGIGMPSKRKSNALFVEKDKNGEWRWFGWVSNNRKDRDGDIFTEEAHKEYVAWLTENSDKAPHFWTLHKAATQREHRTDWFAYDHGFLMMSGKLTEKEAEGILRVSIKYNLGMSHGCFVLREDPANPKLITKYRTYEVSDLPLKLASNPFTRIYGLEKEALMSDRNVAEEYLASLIGEKEAKEVFDITAKADETLDDAGVEKKEVKDEKKTLPDVPEDYSALLKKITDDLGIEELSAYLEETQKVMKLFPTLVEAVAKLNKDKDEVIAEAITPDTAPNNLVWQNRASQSKDTALKKDNKKDQELLEKAPKVSWFNDVEGGAAVETPTDAPVLVN